MSNVPVNLWWNNRERLTPKMLLRLLDELETMKATTLREIALNRPSPGISDEERDRRNQMLISNLEFKISVCKGLLPK